MREKFTAVIPPPEPENYQRFLQVIARNDDNNASAFTWVYNNYSRNVYEFVLLLTRDEWMAEDITQDVFVRLWKHRTKLNQIENIYHYLNRMARNATIDALQKQAREKHHVYVSSELDNEQSVDIFFSAAEMTERKNLLLSFAKQLNGQQKKVFHLKIEGWSGPEIGNALGLAPSTVNEHFARTKEKAVAFFAERFADETELLN